MLILNEIVAASSFDATIVVMSGAAGSSPTESLNVVVFAAGAFGAESAPEAAVGKRDDGNCDREDEPWSCQQPHVRVSVDAGHASRN